MEDSFLDELADLAEEDGVVELVVDLEEGLEGCKGLGIEGFNG